jgi:NitT/TauT family transport system ATP-binding protein
MGKQLILETIGLTKQYESHVEGDALHDVNLQIHEREFVSLVGPSGCGKSTFAHIISGLLIPTSGEVKLRGEEVKGRRQQVTIVSQEDSLFPWKTILENVKLGMYTDKTLTEKEVDEKARVILHEFGLSQYHNHFPAQLSGGMKQRVNIARAIVHHSDILVMDEPFSALDYNTRLFMQQSLLKVWKDTKNSVIFITHHLAESVFLSDTIYVMKPSPGEIVKKIEVDLPRPRTPDIMKTDTFINLEKNVFESLRTYV